jgi:hypothetical protein
MQNLQSTKSKREDLTWAWSNEKLRDWKPLLTTWSALCLKYATVCDGNDAPYWYTERPNVGVLAAAAWTRGWISLEEFGHDKEKMLRTSRRGRCDLYMAGHRREYLVEAKHAWLSTASKDANAICAKALEKALNDARRSRAGSTSYRSVGVVFLGVCASRSKSRRDKRGGADFSDRINALVAEIKKFKGADAKAYCFPKVTAEMPSSAKEHGFGVICLAKRP